MSSRKSRSKFDSCDFSEIGRIRPTHSLKAFSSKLLFLLGSIPSIIQKLILLGICWGFGVLGADREDDRKIGIHSSAIFFGDRAPLAIGLCFALTVGLLGWLGVILTLKPSYWVTLILVSCLWLWQSLWLRNSQPRASYGKFFSQNVLAGFVLLTGMIAGVQP